jgi:hypothetical protein
MRDGAVVALLIVLIIASAGAGYYIGTSSECTTTSTTTSTVTSWSTTTLTLTPHLYQLEFIQESNCPYGSWLLPWGVMINHQTVTQPPNATLPLSYSASRLTGNSTYSTIWLSLPNGTYTYSILPNNFYGQEQSGNVRIEGGNAVVQVYAFITAMGCSTTSTAVGG